MIVEEAMVAIVEVEAMVAIVVCQASLPLSLVLDAAMGLLSTMPPCPATRRSLSLRHLTISPRRRWCRRRRLRRWRLWKQRR
jgi:hypothetical protein